MTKDHSRLLSFSDAILEATTQEMDRDSSVIVMGLGAPDPKGIFGTTVGLFERFGRDRIFDTPTAESAMMGVALGASLVGMRPIITHQRVEFSFLAIDQIFNQAAKWHYMFNGKSRCPIVIRLVVGRGWGTGPQHTQSLESVFGHIPGLKVVAPSNPGDAKGQLIAAIRDDAPVVFIEHRWLHSTFGQVDEQLYEVPLSGGYTATLGSDITLVAYSYTALEALRCAKYVKEKFNISVEVLVLRAIRPLDTDFIYQSVRKTSRLIIFELGWLTYGVGAEIIAQLVMRQSDLMKVTPGRVGLRDVPVPSARVLANKVYPSMRELVALIVEKVLGINIRLADIDLPEPSDVPDDKFIGPF
jgi:pyruvate/2-oxoglutarate/acetoin dehydrogenase E1 component